MGVTGVSGGEQTYDKKIELKNPSDSGGTEILNSCFNAGVGAAISGGNVAGSIANAAFGGVLDNMGQVGQIIKAGMNLFAENMGTSKGHQATTKSDITMGLQAQQTQKSNFTSCLNGLIASVQEGTTSIDEMGAKIKEGLALIKNQDDAGVALSEQRTALQERNQELAAKIESLGGQIKIDKESNSVEITTPEQQTPEAPEDPNAPPGSKKPTSNPKPSAENSGNSSQSSELQALISEYNMNNSIIEGLNVDISTIATDMSTIKTDGENTQVEMQEAKQSLTDMTLEQQNALFNEAKAQIDATYQFAQAVVGGDKNLAKAYEVTNKVVSGAQTAAGVAIAIFDRAGSKDFFKKAGINMAASQIDKLGQKLGVDGLDKLATGKTDVVGFATDNLKSVASDVLNPLIAGAGGGMIDASLTNQISNQMLDAMFQVEKEEK